MRARPPQDILHAPGHRVLVTGAGGQLGRALRAALPGAEFADRADLDVADEASLAAFDFAGVGAIVNAAAFTGVDAAETPPGVAACWAANATGPALLARKARELGAWLVQISSDFVFDGTRETHDEDEPASPLGVYGASKAAADQAVACWERHLIIRTSWLVGDGANFVRSIARRVLEGERLRVVADQFGRLTLAEDLAGGVAHLLASEAPPGVYNLSGDGPPRSWHEIAVETARLAGADATLEPISSATHAAERAVRGLATARRPRNSTLTLERIKSAGLQPRDAWSELPRLVAEVTAPAAATGDRGSA